MYLVHLYVLPAADLVLAPLLLTVSHFVHPEAAAPTALGCALLLVRALALPLPAVSCDVAGLVGRLRAATARGEGAAAEEGRTPLIACRS